MPLISIGGETGLTIPPKNVQELASTMNLVLNDSALRTQYGIAARKRVESEFTAAAMTERTFELYGEVLCS